MLHQHVVAREDALEAGTLVLAHPPVVVHVFVHEDLVVPLKGEIAVVGADVAVQSAGMGNDGLCVADRKTGRRSILVGGGQRRMVVLGSGACGTCGVDAIRRSRAKRSGERRLLGKGGVDGIVNGFVNNSLLQKVFEFL